MPTPIHQQSLMHWSDKDLGLHLGSQENHGDGLAMSAMDGGENYSTRAKGPPSPQQTVSTSSLQL